MALELSTRKKSTVEEYAEAVLTSSYERGFRITPFIITFCDPSITKIDIQNFMELGLHVIRFKPTQISKKNKVHLISMLEQAAETLCEKYRVSSWPIAVSIDIPNGVITTGLLREGISNENVILKENSIVEITSDVQYYNKCDNTRIFVDDQYLIQSFEVGMEMTFDLGAIVMFCVEVINEKTIKCKIHKGGKIGHASFVCVKPFGRPIPPLRRRDIDIIEFAKEMKLDVLTIGAVRDGATVTTVKELLGHSYKPLILSSISDTDGLKNIDDILKESDGIILAREILANQIFNSYQMTAIQMEMNGKCKKIGKLFYISGNILEQTLLKGTLSAIDISDVTNAVLQGASFVLTDSYDPAYLMKAMTVLNNICKSVEPLYKGTDFWRLYLEFPIPVNAAEGCILGAVLTAETSCASVIIINSVTGFTTTEIHRLAPMVIVLSVSTNAVVARRLHLYRGVVSIKYDQKHLNDFALEREARVRFAIEFGIKRKFFKYGDLYVSLQRASASSAYCDMISVNRIATEVHKKDNLYGYEDNIDVSKLN